MLGTNHSNKAVCSRKEAVCVLHSEKNGEIFHDVLAGRYDMFIFVHTRLWDSKDNMWLLEGVSTYYVFSNK